MKRKSFAALLLVLVLTGQALSTGVHSIQVTIGAGTRTQVSSTNLFVRQAVFQNNAANDMRVGGVEVTASLGVALYAASHGSASVLPMSPSGTFDLSDWYVAGTAAQVLDVTYIQ